MLLNRPFYYSPVRQTSVQSRPHGFLRLNGTWNPFPGVSDHSGGRCKSHSHVAGDVLPGESPINFPALVVRPGAVLAPGSDAPSSFLFLVALLNKVSIEVSHGRTEKLHPLRAARTPATPMDIACVAPPNVPTVVGAPQGPEAGSLFDGVYHPEESSSPTIDVRV